MKKYLIIYMADLFILGVLTFFSSFCYAQNDSLLKSDTIHLKVTVFKSNILNSKTGFTEHRFTPYNHKLYNPDIYQYRVAFDPLFYHNWLYGSTFDQYSKFPQNRFNKYDHLSYLISTDPMNHWDDPTKLSYDYAWGEFVVHTLMQILSGK